MKQLELNLKERLLIVEDAENGTYFPPRSVGYHIEKYGEVWTLLAKGSEFTEQVAEDLVDIFDLSYYVDYNHHNPRSYKLTALDSFISAIEAQGYYWGENPINFDDNEIDFNKRYEMRVNWEKAESRTFNPGKSIIFKRLKS